MRDYLSWPGAGTEKMLLHLFLDPQLIVSSPPASETARRRFAGQSRKTARGAETPHEGKRVRRFPWSSVFEGNGHARNCCVMVEPPCGKMPPLLTSACPAGPCKKGVTPARRNRTLLNTRGIVEESMPSRQKKCLSSVAMIASTNNGRQVLIPGDLSGSSFASSMSGRPSAS